MRMQKGRDGFSKWMTVGLVLSLICTVRAADQTWIHGNANNDWSTTSANWDAGVVWTDGNNAIFGGMGETVDVDGAVSVSNITFTVTGYTIGDADADGTFTLSGAPSVITAAAGTTNTISEVLAGSGGLTKEGAGVLKLSGPNSPLTGNTIISAGTVVWGATNALPSGTVTIQDGAALEWNTVGTSANSRYYTVEGSGAGGAGCLINNSYYLGTYGIGRFDLTGDALVANARRVDPSNNNFQGHRLTKIGLGSWNIRGSLNSGTGGGVTVKEGVVQIEICNGAIQSMDGEIEVNTNAFFSLLSYNGPSAACKLDADFVLNKATIVGTSYNLATTAGTPQVAYFGTMTLNGDCAIQIGWGGTGAGLVNDETVRDTQIDVYSEIGGSGNLTINPTDSALSGTISYPVILHTNNTFTGSMALDKGTLILTPSGAVTNCSQLSVAAGATLVVSNTVNAFGDSATLIIANDSDTGSGITLAPGVDDTVGILILGGEIQTTIGTYGSSASGADVQSDEYFSGSGVLRVVSVPPSTMTWIDANSNNDWSLSEANWDAGAVWIQYASALFTGTGEHVEIEDDIKVHNITFNADGYTITDTNANGMLTLSVSPTVVSVVTAGDTATIAEVVDGVGDLTKQGDGKLTLSGGDSPSTGNTLVEAGILYWGANDALPGGSVTVESGATVDFGVISDTAINRRTYTVAGTGTAGQGALIKTGANSVMSNNGINGLTLAGDTTIGGSSRFDLGGYIDFNGFVLTKTGNNSIPFRTGNLQDTTGGVVINQGHMYMENADITIAGPVVINSGATLGTYISSGYTKTFTMPITLNNGGRLWTAGTSTAGTSVFAGSIACSGTAYLYTGYNGSAGGSAGDMIVNSTISGTGTLILNETATGASGAATHTITLNATNTFGGAIQIERGTLLVSASGAINSCTELNILSNAVVNIQNAGDTLSESATIVIADDADTATGMTLAEGVAERVAGLVLGGVTYSNGSGSFGSSASPADHKLDEYFSGTGILLTPPLRGTLMLLN